MWVVWSSLASLLMNKVVRLEVSNMDLFKFHANRVWHDEVSLCGAFADKMSKKMASAIRSIPGAIYAITPWILNGAMAAAVLPNWLWPSPPMCSATTSGRRSFTNVSNFG